MLREWILGHEDSVDELCDFDIVFRVPCRDIHSRNVSEYLEDELPTAHQNMPDTSSLKKQMETFRALWIIDGFDESTAEFKGFLSSLLKNLPAQHKIIITTRPDCLEELDNFNDIKTLSCKLSVKAFVPHQIRIVAEKYLDDVTTFEKFYKRSCSDFRAFLKTPLNLNICLELWKHDPLALTSNLTTHNLYEKLFEKQTEELITRLEGKSGILKLDDIKRYIRAWLYEDLCKISAASMFRDSYKLSISNWESKILCQAASDRNLVGSYCMSSFLDFEESADGLRYFFRHKIQKEVMSAIYLKQCSNEALKEIAIREKDNYLPTYKFEFLFKCCDATQFSRIFGIFLETQNELQEATQLLELKHKNENFFDSLKKELGSWEKSLLLRDPDIQMLKNILQLLIPPVKHITVILRIHNDDDTEYFEKVNNILQSYRHQLIYTIKLDFYFNDEECKSTLLTSPSLINALLHYLKYAISCGGSSSVTLLRKKFCHAHMNITVHEGDLLKILKNILKVKNSFHTLTLALNVRQYDGSSIILDKELLSKAQTDFVMTKCIIEPLPDTQKINFCWNLLSSASVKKIELLLSNCDTKIIEELFEKWREGKLSICPEEILFFICANQLKILYDLIDTTTIKKTTIDFSDDIFDTISVPEYKGKKFQAVKLLKDEQIDDPKTFEALTKISENVYISSFNKTQILKYMKRELKATHLQSLKQSFSGMQSLYVLPHLLNHSDNRAITVKELLTVTKTKIIILSGDLGYGKTSLTK